MLNKLDVMSCLLQEGWTASSVMPLVSFDGPWKVQATVGANSNHGLHLRRVREANQLMVMQASSCNGGMCVMLEPGAPVLPIWGGIRSARGHYLATHCHVGPKPAGDCRYKALRLVPFCALWWDGGGFSTESGV